MTNSRQNPKVTEENEDGGSSKMMWLSMGMVFLALVVGTTIAPTRK